MWTLPRADLNARRAPACDAQRALPLPRRECGCIPRAAHDATRDPNPMMRREYLETVLDEVEARAPDAAAPIVSPDCRMEHIAAQEGLPFAVQLRREGRRKVGVDLCGDSRVRQLLRY